MTLPTLPKRYEVRSLLGEGGQGRVYRVQDSIRDRELALKLVTPAESAFLRREFDTLRQIRHENLIQVFDWGTLPSGEAYYTMELIEGGDWSRRMGKPQPTDEVRHILTGLLRGLAHLHCHGEIHGDLKPENILLGAGGVVKITDTGMGGRGGSGSGKSGTPGYAAPEVWEGAPADVRSDLYSVGVMSYEALTGRHPFAGRTVRQVVSGQLEGWVPSPGVHGVEVPVDLERVVMRALERSPGLRQGNADEFMEGFSVADRIGEILGGKLVGREMEIREIEKLLRDNQPGTPTLLHVSGQPGVGRVALLEEVAQRSIARGEQSRQVDGYPGSIALQLSESLGMINKAHLGVGELAEGLCTSGPLIIWSTSAADLEALTTIARYAWALSIEKQKGAGVLFAVLSDGKRGDLADFERELSLSPLPAEDTEAVAGGFLGNSSLETPLLRRIHDVSGGAPGALISTLRGLINQGVIARRAGSWSFRENQDIQSISVPSLAGPWVSAWQHLSDSEREVLALLALAPVGLPANQTSGVLPSQGIVDSLVAKGWIRKTSTHLRVASEQIRNVVRECPDGQLTRNAARNLLEVGDLLTREERADLAIVHAPTIDSLKEGLWAAEAAVERSDFRRASIRLERCLEIATREKREDLAGDVSLRLADVLHKAGDNSRAERYLTDYYPWSADKPFPIAPREYQLGAIHAARGKLDEASVRFRSAISLASEDGNLAVLLRSHAGLAEIEWQHRGGDIRDASIERIREILARYGGTKGLENELAALTYGLGAALLRMGRREEAAPVLRDGLGLGGGEYWRMRICNALSTAEFYSGSASRALDWITTAWHIAENSGYDSFKPRLLSNRGGILYAMGRFKEALEQHELSSRWAMRIGSAFELLAARSGAAINLVLLADYEQAIAKAREGQKVAESLQDQGQLAKAMEVEALALYSMGDFDASTAITRRAQFLVKDYGALEVKPRLDWLLGRIALAKGQSEEAARYFGAAHSVLVETKDWEDLPGIQIEILRLESPGRFGASVEGIMKIMNPVGSNDIVLIQVYGGIALSAMIMECSDCAKAESLALPLEEILGKAEMVGALDAAWRLNLALGRLACAHGDMRTEQTRYQKALAIIREIAARLSADHRQTYLSSPHVSSALSQISVSLSMN